MTVENLDIQISQSGSDAARQMDQLANSIRKIKAPTASVAGGVKKMSSSFSLGATAAGKFVKSLGRIAFYRAIRTIVKEITQAFKEGLVNAYQFSKGIGGDLANALDTVATKSLTMKNQLGAAFGGLLQAIQPILLRIISLITQAANAIAAFFGALNGGTYLKAKDTATAWNEATGAANKYKNTILGFDEINKLDDTSGGGGGGANPADMFEIASVPQKIQEIADKLKELNSNLKVNIDDVFFNWSNLNGEQIAKKCLVGLSALTGGALGFAIGDIPGAIIGAGLGVVVGLLISSIVFDNDGVLSPYEIATLLKPAVSALCGLAIGFMIGGVPGALLGIVTAVAIKFVLDRAIKFDANGKLDKTSLYNRLLPALTTIIGGLAGLFLVGTGAGLVIGLSIGALISFLVGGKDSEFRSKAKMAAQEIFNKMKPAFDAIFGALLFASVALGSGGALVLTLGLKLVFDVISTDFSAISSARAAAETAANVTLGEKSKSGTTAVYTRASDMPRGAANRYATGGFPSVGDLFIAGERGAELVSSHGGQTQVSNTDQIANSVLQGNSVVVSAIDAMADAVVRAIANKNTNVYLDSKEIRNGQNRLSRAMG